MPYRVRSRLIIVVSPVSEGDSYILASGSQAIACVGVKTLTVGEIRPLACGGSPEVE